MLQPGLAIRRFRGFRQFGIGHDGPGGQVRGGLDPDRNCRCPAAAADGQDELGILFCDGQWRVAGAGEGRAAGDGFDMVGKAILIRIGGGAGDEGIGVLSGGKCGGAPRVIAVILQGDRGVGGGTDGVSAAGRQRHDKGFRTFRLRVGHGIDGETGQGSACREGEAGGQGRAVGARGGGAGAGEGNGEGAGEQPLPPENDAGGIAAALGGDGIVGRDADGGRRNEGSGGFKPDGIGDDEAVGAGDIQADEGSGAAVKIPGAEVLPAAIRAGAIGIQLLVDGQVGDASAVGDRDLGIGGAVAGLDPGQEDPVSAGGGQGGTESAVAGNGVRTAGV